MSRHSKNNTAGAVFTYKEKKMLKGIYGTQTKVLGSESMKKFEQCCICLQKAEDPFCCFKGHLFCKECIMDHMVLQKKKIKRLIKKEKLSEKERIREEDHLKEEQAKVELEVRKQKNEDFGRRQIVKGFNVKLNLDVVTDEKEKLRIEEEALKKKIQSKEVFDYDNKQMKEKLAQSSFWIQEIPLQTSIIKPILAIKGQAKLKKRKLKMICPGDNEHPLKLKYLTKLIIKEIDKKFVCKFCDKSLNFQKVSCLSDCGHVYCQKCLKHIGKNTCLCGLKFRKREMIKLQESGSGYSEHNQNEVKVYTRAFIG